MQVTYAILGGGIIGSAIAYELSLRGIKDVHVFDVDLEGALSSTERNAGGVRHLWQQPVNRSLSRASIALFEQIKSEIGFQQTGYLWLISRDHLEEGQKLWQMTQHNGLPYEQWAISDIRYRYPFIDKTADLAFGIFGPRDGLINSNALKTYYRKKAKLRDVTFHDRVWVSGLKGTDHATFSVASINDEDTAHTLLKDPNHASGQQNLEEVRADRVILAAGAWTRELLLPFKLNPTVQPIRRQISVFKSEKVDLTPYGMVVDPSRVYFHPEGGNILSGIVLKDEQEGYNFDYDPNFFETHLWPALFERASGFENLKHVTGWAGLYSYTPDTSGILGQIPGRPAFFEAHSFTGRGVMQSYGAAIAITDLVLSGKFASIDASALRRERFAKGELLPEGVHI